MKPGKRKQYVEVLASHQIDGTVLPKAIILADGDVFPIDEVTHIYQPVPKRPGAASLRYTVRIRNRETFLFQEADRWFVEMKEPAPQIDAASR